MTAQSPDRGGFFELNECRPDFTCNYENLIVHSRTRQFEKQVDNSGLSIKLGVRGEEHYHFGREKRTIDEDRFLIVNRGQQFLCRMDAREEVEGFCFYLGPGLMAEVCADWSKKPEKKLDDPYSPGNLPEFEDRVYHLEENRFGQFLHRVRDQLLQNREKEEMIADGFFYTMAEQLLDQSIQIRSLIDRLNASRASTRRELYRRLVLARQYIFDNYTREVDLETLGRVAMLSKYHLLRSYKQLFGITPYRDILRLRLERSRVRLRQGESISEIAFDLGFSDRRAFAKAFRKTYGMAPSVFRDFY